MGLRGHRTWGTGGRHQQTGGCVHRTGARVSPAACWPGQESPAVHLLAVTSTRLRPGPGLCARGADGLRAEREGGFRTSWGPEGAPQ